MIDIEAERNSTAIALLAAVLLFIDLSLLFFRIRQEYLINTSVQPLIQQMIFLSMICRDPAPAWFLYPKAY